MSSAFTACPRFCLEPRETCSTAPAAPCGGVASLASLPTRGVGLLSRNGTCARGEVSVLHRNNGPWQDAMERLMVAAEDPSEERLDRAARQFSIALRAEGLTPFRPPGKPRRGSK
ncbi:MAG: hypothetical protein WAV18_23245 [Roseiarcus sp.]